MVSAKHANEDAMTMFNIGDIVVHRFQAHSYGYVLSTTYKGKEHDEIAIQWFNSSIRWHLPYVLMKVE